MSAVADKARWVVEHDRYMDRLHRAATLLMEIIEIYREMDRALFVRSRGPTDDVLDAARYCTHPVDVAHRKVNRLFEGPNPRLRLWKPKS